MKEFITKVISKEDLCLEDVKQIISAIEKNEFNETQLSGLLCAIESKGVTLEELSFFVDELGQRAKGLELGKDCIDICGTGGDETGTFNISTASMFVVAGAGVKVTKHGNRAVSSNSGSFDVLEELGIDASNGSIKAEETLEKTNVALLFAPNHHPIFKNIASTRKSLGIKTIFNLMGPLLNPCGVKKQLIGVFNPKYTELIAGAMKNSERVMVVNGDGMDEITITGKTKITELRDGKLETYYFDPKEHGINYAPIEALVSSGKGESAKIIKAILDGKKDVKRDVVILNAAAALIVSGKARSFEEGLVQAEESIDSGRALETLNALHKLLPFKHKQKLKKHERG